MTSVTFWLDSRALRRALLACARKPRSEFLGTAMLELGFELRKVVVVLMWNNSEFAREHDVQVHRPPPLTFAAGGRVRFASTNSAIVHGLRTEMSRTIVVMPLSLHA